MVVSSNTQNGVHIHLKYEIDRISKFPQENHKRGALCTEAKESRECYLRMIWNTSEEKDLKEKRSNRLQTRQRCNAMLAYSSRGMSTPTMLHNGVEKVISERNTSHQHSTHNSRRKSNWWGRTNRIQYITDIGFNYNSSKRTTQVKSDLMGLCSYLDLFALLEGGSS